MKKALLVLSISSLTATTALANESSPTPELMPEPIKTEFFVGGGLGYHSAKAELSALGQKESKTAKGSAFHIRGGAYIQENHRITGTINFTGDNELWHSGATEFDDEINLDLAQTEFLVSYDYVHAINSQFSVFGGATAGLTKNTFKGEYIDLIDSSENGSAKSKETDFVYGLQAGVQYKIMKNVSADFQYRHMFESYSEGNLIELSVPNNSEFTVSVDYRF
ncbi:opacity protein-like surface antigen [Vibrio crassostreae]|uniref:porin family protein n=1 Tax=Vibrio crassostreae TaxID=246167 RepID=UPI00104D449D|nr:outer membrane beta-barrel protein [Vibrio crassostreae]TCN80261.1 opacity protein-like surface antigen [Vibrio crassostreae]TWD74158.1 opacity protein-like surface antigen [Vibrio crassostreae]